MRRALPLLFCLLSGFAVGCDRPICVVDAENLRLGRMITFDDQPGNFGRGRPVDQILALPGASFGAHFAGQNLTAAGDFDSVSGPGLGPLTLLTGEPGQNFAILKITGATLLSGLGPRGFPMISATGEGSIAVLFDADQPVLRLELRGGEGGTAQIIFLRRDGTVIDSHDLGPLGEQKVGFARRGDLADIAGLVISNQDPEGIALDAVAFDGAEQTSKLLPSPRLNSDSAR